MIFSTYSLATYATTFEVNALGSESSDYKNCSASKTNDLLKAEQKAQIKLHKLIQKWPTASLSRVRKDYVIPQNRVWKKRNPKHAEYISYYQKMGETFLEMRDKYSEVRFECKTERENRCKGNEVFAYVLFFFGHAKPVIHFCPAYFDKNEDQKAAILLHELSHYASSTEDLALDWSNGNSVNLHQASIDAYHIENLAEEDISSNLGRMVWNPLWPKIKTPKKVK
jgi:hypothetical protein